MKLKLRNTWRYKGDDWWEWEAFLDDGGSGDLERVSSVEYILHETFPDPIRKVKDRSGGFRLESGGWGEFGLKAFATLKDGTKKRLTHEIKLMYDPPEGVS